MESRWANQILQEMQPKKDKVERSSKQGKKAVLIVLPVMFLLLIVGMLLSSKQIDQNMVMGILVMTGCFAFILLIVVVCTRKSKDVDLSKEFVDSVNHVISIDGAQMLDEEMEKQPNATFSGYMDEYFYATDHYIVFKRKRYGLFMYRVIRKEELAKVSFHATRHGVERYYQYYLDNVNERSLAVCSIQGKANAMRFEEFLNSQVPGIEFRNHNLIV